MAAADHDHDDEWVQKVLETGRFKSCKLLAKGGMGAAFKVQMKSDLIFGCIQLLEFVIELIPD